MSASVALKKKFKFGNGFGVVADVTLDSSYPTGGEALTAQQFGLTTLDFVLCSPSGGYIAEFDHANSKIKVFTPVKVQAAHTHVENAAETYTKDAATAEGGAIAAAAAPEVANTTDLHTVVVRVIAIGI